MYINRASHLQPQRHTTPVHRPASMNPTESAAPVDTATLHRAAAEPPPGSRALAETGMQTAQIAAFGIFGAAGDEEQEISQRVDRLEQKGIKFERKGRFLFWLGDWKNSEAKHTKKYIRKGKEERLRAIRKKAGDRGRPIQVNSLEDLRELDAFYGAKAPEALSHPKLARVLADLDENGVQLISGRNDYYYYGNDAGPYGAYNFLTDDAKSMDELSARVGEQSWQLTQPEDAYMVAYLQNLVEADQLQRPDQARLLKRLTQSGYTLSSGDAFESYKQLGDKLKVEEIEVSFHEAPLGKISAEDVKDPKDLYVKLSGQKQRVEGFEKVYGERALEAWGTIQKYDSPQPFTERVQALTELYQAEVEQPDALFGAVVGEAGSLTENTSRAVKVAKALEEATGEKAAVALAEAKKAEDFDTFVEVLGWVQDGPTATRALQLSAHEGAEKAPIYREFIRRSLEAEGVENAVALDALENLNQKGTFMEDAGMVLALLQANPTEEAIETYNFIHEQVEAKEREPFVSMYEAHPELKAVTNSWNQVKAAGAEAWVKLYQASGENAVETADEAFKLLPAPEEADHLSILLSVNRGDLKVAQEQWQTVKKSNDPETLYQLIEATGSYEGGQAARNHLKGIQDQRPFEERRTALIHLLNGADKDLSQAIRDYRYLTAVASGSLDEAAATYQRLLKATVQTDAKLAMAALYQAPPQPDSATSSDSLARALEAVGNFGHARPVWESLEEPGADRKARVELLEKVGTLCKGRIAALIYQGMLTTPLTGRTEAALTELTKSLGRTEIRPEGSWDRREVPGYGEVWTDSPEGNYQRNTDDALTSEVMDLSQLQGCKAQFQLSRDLATDDDRLVLEARRPSSEWKHVNSWGGREDWKKIEADLSAYDGGPAQIRFRMVSDDGATGDGVQVAGLKVEGVKLKGGRAVSWSSGGSWGETTEDGRRVWADSPGGRYSSNANETLTSEPLDLSGMISPKLVFAEKHATESGYDRCFLSVSNGSDWDNLETYEGQSDWNTQIISLPTDRNKPRLRFQLTSDGSTEKEGFYFEGARIVDAGDEENGKAFLFGQQRSWQVEKLLHNAFAQDLTAAQRGAALAHTAEAVKEVGVGKTLSIWPLLKGRLVDPEAGDHRQALGVLAGDLEAEELAARHQRVLGARLPGEKLVDVARVLDAVGPKEFEGVRRLLLDSSPDQSGLGAHTAFLSRILENGVQQALQSWNLVAVPIGKENVEERRDAFLGLARIHDGDIVGATRAYQELFSWVNPNESLADRVLGYEQIHSALNGDIGKCLKATKFLTDHQLKGALSRTSFKVVGERLASIVLLRDDQELEPALQATLSDEGPIGDIEFEEDQVVVGDFTLGRQE